MFFLRVAAVNLYNNIEGVVDVASWRYISRVWLSYYNPRAWYFDETALCTMVLVYENLNLIQISVRYSFYTLQLKRKIL